MEADAGFCDACLFRPSHLPSEFAFYVGDEVEFHCPKCGCCTRFSVRSNGRANNGREAAMLKVQCRKTGEKPYLERKSGSEVCADTGEMQYVFREIQRDKGTYRELIGDYRNRIVIQCEEPLRTHQGHGQAKHKRTG